MEDVQESQKEFHDIMDRKIDCYLTSWKYLSFDEMKKVKYYDNIDTKINEFIFLEDKVWSDGSSFSQCANFISQFEGYNLYLNDKNNIIVGYNDNFHKLCKDVINGDTYILNINKLCKCISVGQLQCCIFKKSERNIIRRNYSCIVRYIMWRKMSKNLSQFVVRLMFFLNEEKHIITELISSEV